MEREWVKRQRDEIVEKARLTLERGRELTKSRGKKLSKFSSARAAHTWKPGHFPLQPPSSVAVCSCAWELLSVRQGLHVHASGLEAFGFVGVSLDKTLSNA